MSKSKKVVSMGKDRNKAARARQAQRAVRAQVGSAIPPMGWKPLVKGEEVPPGAMGIAANDRCEITAWPFNHPGDPNSKVPALHLVIAERGRSLLWEELNQIKLEMCGPQVEAVELYPSVQRELIGERKRHLFCLPPGEEWPIGLVPQEEAARRQRQYELMERIQEYTADKILQVIFPEEEGEDLRIFKDKDDAVEAVEDAVLREVPIGQLPQGEQEGVLWSEKAAEYRDQITAEIEAIVAKAKAEAADEDVQDVEGLQDVVSEDPVDEEEDAEAEAEAANDLAKMRAEMRKGTDVSK